MGSILHQIGLPVMYSYHSHTYSFYQNSPAPRALLFSGILSKIPTYINIGGMNQ